MNQQRPASRSLNLITAQNRPKRPTQIIYLSQSDNSDYFTSLSSNKNPPETPPPVTPESSQQEQRKTPKPKQRKSKKRPRTPSMKAQQPIEIVGSQQVQKESPPPIAAPVPEPIDLQTQEAPSKSQHKKAVLKLRKKFLNHYQKRSEAAGKPMMFKFKYAPPFHELRLIRPLDDWHTSMQESGTEVDIIRPIELEDFIDGQMAISAVKSLIGETEAEQSNFYIICKFKMTDGEVLREEGFSNAKSILKMMPDKMISYADHMLEKLIGEKGGVVRLNLEL